MSEAIWNELEPTKSRFVKLICPPLEDGKNQPKDISPVELPPIGATMLTSGAVTFILDNEKAESADRVNEGAVQRSSPVT